jgi:hypothetical protein
VRKSLLLWTLIVSSATASAATAPEGIELKVRRGFFTETDIGGFFTLGGDNDYSNLQTYLQLGIGYDISESVELGLHVGVGSNAANCFSGITTANECTLTDHFTVTFFDLTAAYLFRLADRFYLSPKLLGGYTLLDPAPVESAGGTPMTSGVNGGLGIGIEYATYMDHFSVGIDFVARFIVGPNIASFQFFPRVKYTF